MSCIEPLESRRLLSSNLIADFGGIYPTDSVTLNGVSYFAADDGVHGKELYKSDGTPAGTALVSDLVSGAAGSGIQAFDVVNSHVVFFTVTNYTSQYDFRMALWTTDGTQAGTVKLADFGQTYYNFPMTAVVPGAGGTQRLVFSVSHGHQEADGFALWVSDGTLAGTRVLKDFAQRIEYDTRGDDAGLETGRWHMPVVNGRAMFVTGPNDHQLWASNGTVAGTVDLTSSFNTGNGHEFTPARLTSLDDNTVLFAVYDYDGHGFANSLWSTDGTLAGTTTVLSLGTHSITGSWRHVGSLIYFTKYDELGPGVEDLYRTDGTAAGTFILVASNMLRIGDGGTTTIQPLRGNRIIFACSDVEHGTELWTSDGTVAGTYLLKELTPGADETSFNPAGEIGGVAYFMRMMDPWGDFYSQLWRSDGTVKGTFMIDDMIESVPGTIWEFKHSVVDDKLVIEAFVAEKRVDTWVYDPATMSALAGRTQGTAQLSADGTLRIYGTNAADAMKIYRLTSDASRLAVNINGVKRSFAAASVLRIYVYGYGGNDQIAVYDGYGRITARTRIWGGEGRDLIYSGAARDTIDGGNGDDTIGAGNNDDLLAGGAGDDSIVSGNGNDTASGDAGADSLWGNKGDDVISGGGDDSSDQLDGGSGADVIFGNAVLEIFYNGKQGEEPGGIDDLLIL